MLTTMGRGARTWRLGLTGMSTLPTIPATAPASIVPGIAILHLGVARPVRSAWIAATRELDARTETHPEAPLPGPPLDARPCRPGDAGGNRVGRRPMGVAVPARPWARRGAGSAMDPGGRRRPDRRG